jgi:hypothetical protein
MAEADAAGVPVVATPVGIGPQIAYELLDSTATAREWAEAIVRVSRSDTDRLNLFSLDRFVSEWAKVLT